ncbi:hypothetical protein [Streptomyces sp. NRRL S-920]|uniref:hypothetical protein n=1 Tax=Streptomyces sp. NRRL S-920 TaxID=1463921 RepID=UPI0004CC81CD|nr:hypothetical protein [Streptomyces sp. NRRL S-920]
MVLLLIPIAYLVLFLAWTVAPIVLPRDRLGLWLTVAHLALSVLAVLLAWLSDIPLAQPAAIISALLGGLLAALRLLLQRAFADSRTKGPAQNSQKYGI